MVLPIFPFRRIMAEKRPSSAPELAVFAHHPWISGELYWTTKGHRLRAMTFQINDTTPPEQRNP
jgi:hypothetical protein